MATGVATGLIVCCLRHEPLDTSLAVADAAVRHRDLVAGLDLAGDETYPGSAHREAFDLAHAAGVPVTVHAGEAAGPASVWEAIDVLGARRIGHGVRCVRRRGAGPAATARPDSTGDVSALQRPHRCGAPAWPTTPPTACWREALPSPSTPTAAPPPTPRSTASSRCWPRTFGWTAQHERVVQDNAREAAFAARR